ncbi:uridine kinase [Bacillus sp. AFS015802]|uniref:kinase n=1 Tax=Bacillus sp. AFS015802 TaxID=2033486 RepID=UPI000BFAB050|nr:kinase [Bacillus sp. AFS015802]PFA63090.1 uridine kinase [Bacillus sp. AFS015802]
MINAFNQVTETVLIHYHKRPSPHRPFIVGVDGLGGSGKTTLAEALKREIKYSPSILHLDDFIVEKGRRYGTGNEEWYEYYALQWDVASLSTNLFQKLHHNLEIILPFYDSSTGTIVQKDFHYAQDTIILIEGVFLQRKEWRDFFDYVIFLDCPPETRAERVIRRDAYLGDEQERIAKYERRYWKAEEHYLLHEDPVGRADYIFSEG